MTHPLMKHSALTLFAQRTRIPTSARSIGFCVIWVFISSSSSSNFHVPPEGGIGISDDHTGKGAIIRGRFVEFAGSVLAARVIVQSLQGLTAGSRAWCSCLFAQRHKHTSKSVFLLNPVPQ